MTPRLPFDVPPGAGDGRAARRRREPAGPAHSVRAVLAIFYFVILLPMRRRQKKVQEFLDGLKVGDKVVTTGGLYGSITKLGDKSRPAADRRQGPRRGVARGHRRLSRARSRWCRRAPPRPEARDPARATDTHDQESPLETPRDPRRRRPSARGPSTRVDKKVRLGLDLKGGVHLVLRVQTDDALRVETETAMERLRERAGEGRRHRASTATLSGRRRSSSPACRTRRTPWSGSSAPRSRTPTTASPASGGTYRFSMKPNIAVQLRDDTVTQAHPDDRAPRQRARRRRADRRAARRRRSDPRAAAGRHRRRAREGHHQVDGAARAEAGRERPGVDPRGAAPGDNGADASRRRRSCPASSSGGARRGAASTLLPGAADAGRSPAATCATRGRRSTRTTSRRSASRSSRTAR